MLKKGNNHKIIQKIILTRKNWEQNSKIYFSDLIWFQSSKKINFELLRHFNTKQHFNHFVNHQIISTKAGLLNSLKKIFDQDLQQVFRLHPLTFEIRIGAGDHILGLNMFIRMFKMIERKFDSGFMNKKDFEFKEFLEPGLNAGANIWILKPNGFNRGRGITLFRSLEDLEILLREEKTKNDNFENFNRNTSKARSLMQKKANRRHGLIRATMKIPPQSSTDHFIIQKYFNSSNTKDT